MSDQNKVIRVFEYALNQEETGLSFFQNSIERMGVGAAVTALKRLIKEERKHIEFISLILTDLRSDVEIDLDTAKRIALEPTNYFDDRAQSEFLEQCVEGSMVPDVTIFSTAWLIEKDLSDFYARMAAQTQGRPQSALTMLSDWEKEHERFFRQYRDRLHEVYANMPWGG